MTAWFYDECYLRFCAEDYSLTDLTNVFSHLSNNCIARKSLHFQSGLPHPPCPTPSRACPACLPLSSCPALPDCMLQGSLCTHHISFMLWAWRLSLATAVPVTSHACVQRPSNRVLKLPGTITCTHAVSLKDGDKSPELCLQATPWNIAVSLGSLLIATDC